MEGRWTDAPSDEVSQAALLDLRRNGLFMRGFHRLQRLSPFPEPYAYLYIFLAVAGIVLFLQLPLLWKTAALALAVPKLRPKVQAAQKRHAGDMAKLNQELQRIYREGGVNPATGCVKGFLDVGLIVGFYFAFRGFVPQLQLDDARFFWTADLAGRDFKILLVWGAIGLVHIMISPRLAQSSAFGLFVQGAVGLTLGGLLAWFLHWPAYLMLFWSTLWLATVAFHVVLVSVHAQRG